MKIGVFGGAFDPVHLGHLRLAAEFARRLCLDRVMLIPTFVPPHKLRSDMASAAHRLEMCRLSVENDQLFMVSDIEIKRGGASFTADTLRELNAQRPQDELYLITGADMFLTLGTWNRFDEIAVLAVICAAPRNGTDALRMREYAQSLQKRGARCIIEDIPELSVSSTEIRRKINVGVALDGLVSPEVEQYIKEHGLYRNDITQQNSDSQFIEIIKGRLTQRRFFHSLAVAEQAEHLAPFYGADPQKAYTAGILHDIMKDAGGRSQLQILSDFGIILDNTEMQLSGCWHAVAGALFIRHVLQIGDDDIINAVRFHTTARAGMSPLEETVFIADFTSADRDYPDVDEMRRQADMGVEPAMIYALSYTIRDLLDKSAVIHPDSIHAYNERIAARRKGGKTDAAKKER